MSVFTFDLTVWTISLLSSCFVNGIIILCAKLITKYKGSFISVFNILIFSNFGFSFFIYFYIINPDYFYFNIIKILVLIITVVYIYKYSVTNEVNKIVVFSLLDIDVCFSVIYIYFYKDLLNSEINYILYMYCVQCSTSLYFQFILLIYTKIYQKEHNYKVTSEFPNEECSICLENFKEPVIKTNCSHFFHKQCIEKAFEVNKNCPLCRMNLV